MNGLRVLDIVRVLRPMWGYPQHDGKLAFITKEDVRSGDSRGFGIEFIGGGSMAWFQAGELERVDSLSDIINRSGGWSK